MPFVGGRQVGCYGVQKGLNAFVSQRAPTENRDTFASESQPPHSLLQLRIRERRSAFFGLFFFFTRLYTGSAQQHAYFRRGYGIKIVTKFCQQQFGELIVQISNLWEQRRAVGETLGVAIQTFNILKPTCSIKAILASLTSFASSASSDWSRGLLSNIRPSSLRDPCFQSSFWLVTKSTTPKKFLPLPTGIYKTGELI